MMSYKRGPIDKVEATLMIDDDMHELIHLGQRLSNRHYTSTVPAQYSYPFVRSLIALPTRGSGFQIRLE